MQRANSKMEMTFSTVQCCQNATNQFIIADIAEFSIFYIQEEDEYWCKMWVQCLTPLAKTVTLLYGKQVTILTLENPNQAISQRYESSFECLDLQQNKYLVRRYYKAKDMKFVFVKHEYFLPVQCSYSIGQTVFIACKQKRKDKLLCYAEWFEHQLFPATTHIATMIAAQILVAVNALHLHGYVFQQMEPDNLIYMNQHGHVYFEQPPPLLVHSSETRTLSFHGTPLYLSREIVLCHDTTPSSDFWSFGCIVYEILTGIPPFYSDNVSQMYQFIVQAQYDDSALDAIPHASSLIAGLLDTCATTRLGGSPMGIKEIMQHPFFACVNWQQIESRNFSLDLSANQS